jgi:hypothetical protein
LRREERPGDGIPCDSLVVEPARRGGEGAGLRYSGGYKGVGEGGAIGAPPAVINAVADALAPFGVDITHLPITPASIVALLHKDAVS